MTPLEKQKLVVEDALREYREAVEEARNWYEDWKYRESIRKRDEKHTAHREAAE